VRVSVVLVLVVAACSQQFLFNCSNYSAPSLHNAFPPLCIHCAVDGELKLPFSSRLWTMRRAVQRGYEALYTVQVSDHSRLLYFHSGEEF
jgi:hypothetical protein